MSEDLQTSAGQGQKNAWLEVNLGSTTLLTHANGSGRRTHVSEQGPVNTDSSASTQRVDSVSKNWD